MSEPLTEMNKLRDITKNLLDLFITLNGRLFTTVDISTELGLTATQFIMLAALRNGPIPVGKVAEMIGIAKPNATPVVRSLIERGFVEKRTDDTDRRLIIIALTESGNDIVARMIDHGVQKLSDTYHLTKPNQKAIVSALEILKRN